jgi:hypothetical protein
MRRHWNRRGRRGSGLSGITTMITGDPDCTLSGRWSMKHKPGRASGSVYPATNVCLTPNIAEVTGQGIGCGVGKV